ncbi:tetratricopeptide repeat protein [Candidatus Omnitrophota bacterium]
MQPKHIQKKNLLISTALIIILGLSVYFGSLGGKFIWDDRYLVEDNVYIKNWHHIPKIFTKDIGAGSGRTYNFHRPLQTLSYMVDYSLWKLDVRGYHLTNILLHILVVLGIYWLVSILFKDSLLSFLTSIFFLVHPIHAGPVNYISARANSLVALFMLLAIIFYIKALDIKKPILFLSMILTYIAALLSRELALILPVLLLLYHYIFKKKIKPREFLSILTITFIYILLRFTVLKTSLVHPVIATTLFERLPGFFVAISSYIRLLILPFDLHMEYGMKLFDLTDPRVTIGLLLLTLSLIYGLRKEKSNNLILFSVSWFFIMLLPVSNLYPVNAYMSEGWLYVPSIGFFLLLAKVLSHLYRTERFRIFTIILTIGLLSFYSSLTIKENTHWREPIAFYKRTLKYAPDSPRVHNNLGNAYYNMGREEEAIALYKKALEIDPDNEEAYFNQGVIYDSTNRNKEAISSYKKAIEINPDYADAYHNLGVAYNSINRNKEAISSYKKAIEINPDHADAYNNLGVAYNSINRNAEAIASYKKAIEINPGHGMAYNNLGNACYNANKKEEAIASYKKALKINPRNIDAYNNLNFVYDSIK